MKKLALIVLILVLMVNGCNYIPKVELTKEVMGTFCTITVYNEDSEKAENVINAAFAEIERIENLLSIYNNKSEVYFLNENGFIENPSEELMTNIKKSLYYSNLTNGAFDITVQPILDLYTHTFSDLKRPPTADEVNNTLRLVGHDYIFIKDNKIILRKEGMKITLGGIAKGYAVDKAIGVLKENGIEHALVSMKSSVRAIGNKGNEDWSIALQNPRNEKEYITIIKMKDNSLSTSGDYERYFDENKTFHHIINPKTGYSADELMSVTIITDKAMDADAISTSVFVLGKEKGMELIESLDNVEGMIITRDKEIVKSSGFED